MEENKLNNSQQMPESANTKREYTAPRLQVLGSVTELTLGSGGTSFDGSMRHKR